MLATALTTMVCIGAPMPAAAQEVRFSIPAGSLKTALRRWTQQSGRDILYRDDEVRNARTRGVVGPMTAETALGILLADSGFAPTFHESGAVALVRQDTEGNATPEILVTGKHDWALNTGIARSRDDSQPFIVLSQEDIRRSGAPDLDTFLRNQLNVNAGPTAGDQATAGDPARRGISRINLRGLGARETLILIDGRRQPGVNLGNGQINQPQITGIPLASIERIEVLASSASGIYGSGATGGVINIVLRRGYQGGELTLNYADTSDFAQGDGRIDLTAARTLEGGRTNVSLTASWRKQRPLLYRDRDDLRTRGRTFALANDPALYDEIGTPAGATPNFRSTDNSPLQLKPEFGGAVLGSSYGSVPNGYRGLAVDGANGLVQSIGRYNLDQPDSAVGEGARAPLLYGAENLSGMLAVRREFNPWLTLYVEGAASRAWSSTFYTRAPGTITLAASAPNNPFVQDLNVSLPQLGAEASARNRNDQLRGVFGAIVKLPYQWQALGDLSWSRSRFVADHSLPGTTLAFNGGLAQGEQDILRDMRGDPLRYDFVNSSFGSFTTPATSTITTASLRLAGPLPLKLPGGATQMTVNLERSREVSGATISAMNGFIARSLYTPERTQTITALYGEVAFPIVGDANTLPLVHLLELRLSARYERYEGAGAFQSITCQMGFGQLPSDDVFTDCPPAGTDFGRATTRNAHTDPSVSLRWAPIPDVTFRGSYTTGYLPPQLDQLTRIAGVLGTTARDPLRGGEVIGRPGPDGQEIDGFYGGNPDVQPESSTTYSLGMIVTPRFLSGLRFSADWTRIRKHDNYYDPTGILFTFDDPVYQRAFEVFLARHPDRVTRGAPSDGFAVGPITSVDVSLANLVGSQAEAVDFALDYSDKLFGGTIDLSSSATWVRDLSVQRFPGEAAEDYTGVNTPEFRQGYADNGSLRWRGNASVRWSRGPVAVSWQGRYFDGYYLNLDRAFVTRQASAKVDAQFFNDIGATYSFPHAVTLRAGVNNLLGKKPAIDTYAYPILSSSYGDPRLTSFYLTVTKAF
ncbi:TonB-dependent receptor [Sphingomonas hankookensis]|uniref:TonB-dependent receptor n=1 Tax=Sphingomonas hankookensis TaxID=563996 RepID=UPI003D3026B7